MKCFLIWIIVLVVLLTVGCAPDDSTPELPSTDPSAPDGELSDPDGEPVIEGLQWLGDQPSERVSFPSRGVHIAYVVNSTAAGKILGECMQEVTDGMETSRVSAVANYGYRFVCWSDGNTSPARRLDTAEQNTVITAIFDYDCSDLPAVVLTTETGTDVQSKTDYIGGTLAIINAGDDELGESTIEVRGRGNFTWTAHEKKSYKVKFPTKIAPLSVGEKNKTWVLMANVCDLSLLRNHTALRIVDEFDRIVYSPNSTCVDLYLNGEYRGVYLLAEEITADTHVGLDESMRDADVDTGYLLELSTYSTDVAFTLQDRKFEIKNDLSSNKTLAKQQKKYITEYVTDAYGALASGNRELAELYIDVNTLVDAYLAEELLKNLDMGWDSFYLHKDRGGKLRFGPLWDFDLALGNSNLSCQYVDGLYCAEGNEDTAMQRNPWFIAAMKQEWFRDLVCERWDEMLPKLQKYPAEILALGARYEASFDRNFVVWQIFGIKQNRETPLITSMSSNRENVEYLAAWLAGRIEWLDTFFHSSAYARGHNSYPDGVNTAESKRALEFAEELELLELPLSEYISQNKITTTAAAVENRAVTLLFDGDTATKWYAEITPSESCVDVCWRTTEPVVLSGYTIATGNNTADKPQRNPLVWVLYGSDDGRNWTLLDMVGSADEILGKTNQTAYGFEVEDKGAYNRFMLRICGNKQVQLSEIVLYGTPKE